MAGARWDGVQAGSDVQVDDGVPDVEVLESVWIGADLAGRRLTGFRCRDTRFERCDLSGVVLDGATLTRVSFMGCRMTGAVLSGAELRDVRISESSADLMNLRMVEATYLLVEDSSLRQAEFYRATVAHSGLLGCDFTGADFTDCTLTAVDLRGSVLDDLRGALSLGGATISPDQVVALAPSLLAAMGVAVTMDGPVAQS